MKSELTVIDESSGSEASCASVLKVLADETRLAVVEQLLDGPMHVGQINDVLDVEPTLLSHHLRVLREAHLVTSERDGKYLVYSLAESILQKRRGRGINLGCCVISFD